jgi:hypothetical protein
MADALFSHFTTAPLKGQELDVLEKYPREERQSHGRSRVEAKLKLRRSLGISRTCRTFCDESMQLHDIYHSA